MPQGTDHLTANETLQHGQFIVSHNGIYQVIFQADGNLVLYKRYPGMPLRPLWASNTAGHTGDRCIMQADGNLVLYDPGNKPIWASNTNGHAQSRLIIQDDGNLVIYAPNNSPLWASNTVSALPPSGPAASGSQALPGQTLAKDHGLQTSDGRYTFVFQSDSNLVLYKNYPTHPRRAIWASGTNGRPGAVCNMQADGNLVIYDADAHALWASGSNGHPGSRLVVQTDGNTVIYQPNQVPVWATNTVQHPVPTGPSASGSTQMQPGQVLLPGQSVHSASNRYRFVFQTDGNLVLYMSVPGSALNPIWASNTSGRVADVCIMQGDGNLVIYDPDAHPVWASGSSGRNGAHLVAQDDGNVVIYTPAGAPVWSTDTYAIDLNFTMQQQTQSNWCWAAVSASVARFFSSTTTWTQCKVANTQLGRTDCCGTGASGPCNVYGYLDKGLDEVGHFDHMDSGTTAYQTLRDQVRGGKPVGIRVEWSGGGAHFIAAVGADPGDYVLVGDPGGGTVSLVPYNTLKTNYSGSGTWTHTYYTKS